MKERQSRQGETLGGIAGYLARTDFTDPRVLHLKAEILQHNGRVKVLIGENLSAKREPTVRLGRRRLTKDGLRETQLIPLARRGRKLAIVHPELGSALKVPHKHASIFDIADAAERFADALTPHLDVLIDAKFPRTCLEDLRRDGRTLRDQAEAAEAARRLLNRSNRALTEELALARHTIDELDAVLRSLPNYAQYQRLWEVHNRMHGRLGRPTKRRLAARKRAAARAD